MSAGFWKEMSEDAKVSAHRLAAASLAVFIFICMLIITGMFAKSDIKAEKKIVEILEIDSVVPGIVSGELAAAAGSTAKTPQDVSEQEKPSIGSPKTKLMEIPEPVIIEKPTPSQPVSSAMEVMETGEPPSVTNDVRPAETQPIAQPETQKASKSAAASAAEPTDKQYTDTGTGKSDKGSGSGVLVNGSVDAAGESLENIGVKELTKIKLTYPPAAYHLNRDGYVEIEFSIDKNGSTKDIKVISADPPGLFDKSAISSISRMKYSPKIINGQPVDVVNVRKFIAFTRPSD